MESDQCIVVDFDDKIVNFESKKATHTFSAENPRGVLHRAFSVFLFNDKNELLLQQRASEKITFADVWTNTCCSHPVSGCIPNEVDEDDDVAKGKIDGIKAAAVRKLKHELGIEGLDITQFQYLTRVHYWATDRDHGVESPWGEHEIDYMLFCKARVSHAANPEEVQATRYVSQTELQTMFADPTLKWSPWFKLIAQHLLPVWWDNIDEALSSDRFVELETIHRFDPPDEYMGGAGKAGKWLGEIGS